MHPWKGNMAVASGEDDRDPRSYGVGDLGFEGPEKAWQGRLRKAIGPAKVEAQADRDDVGTLPDRLFEGGGQVGACLDADEGHIGCYRQYVAGFR
jgi:hypothetical protein